MTWQDIRLQVLERDLYSCQNCERMDKDLDVHHIIPKRLGGLDVLNNLVSLCEKCHALLELKKPYIEKVVNLVGIPRFIGRLSTMRKDKLVIYIPIKYHKELLEKYKDTDIKVTVEPFELK